ncbi:MAG: lysophospholipid acyltransferase family protein [Pseudomonadales bacterium]
MWSFRALARALSLLSIAGQRRVGRWLGWLAWRARAPAARNTMINLSRCFPAMEPLERRRLARESLAHTGQLLAETGTTFHWPEPRWRALILEIEGEHLLSSGTDGGKPLLILAPHFGNWEFLALYLGKHGVTALYDPPRVRALEPLIVAARSRSGATLLPIGPRGMREFVQALRNNSMVALLPDQSPEREAGVYAPLFGVPALTMTFAHRLIRRSNPRVVMGAAVRCRGGFRLRFTELPAQIADPDPLVSATTMNQAIEALVLTEPAQYQWEYKRFKRQPPGEPYLYPRR